MFYEDYDNGMNDNFIPIKDQKIYLDGLEYDKDYSYGSLINMLLDGNYNMDILFQHEMTIDELIEYFKIDIYNYFTSK